MLAVSFPQFGLPRHPLPKVIKSNSQIHVCSFQSIKSQFVFVRLLFFYILPKITIKCVALCWLVFLGIALWIVILPQILVSLTPILIINQPSILSYIHLYRHTLMVGIPFYKFCFHKNSHKSMVAGDLNTAHHGTIIAVLKSPA